MAYQPILNPMPVTGTLTTTSDPNLIDAFSRQRVSQLSSLLNLTQLYDKSPLFVDEVLNGTATSVHSTTNASVTMSTVASGDYAIRQTKQRFHYFAGKSQLIFETGALFEAETNIEKRRGYFSSSTSAPYTASLDGLFLLSEASGISINVYRSGTQVEKTAQASWNVDTLNGAGPSGITVDWSKNQILAMDFQYLGIGRVRWYLDIDGVLVLFHESMHANSTIDIPYMTSPNQPMRWEIRQTGAGSGSMRHICASVNSEGSFDQIGASFGLDNGTNHVDANSPGTEYAVLGMRLKSTHLDASVILKNLSIISFTTDSFLWRLKLNPTVAGTFTYSGVTNSPIEFATGATANTITGGTILESDLVYQQSTFQSVGDEAVRIGSSIDGTPDELVLTAIPRSSNADIGGTMNIKVLS